MDRTSVGIDIAKNKFDVAVWIDKKKYKNKSFHNTHEGFLQLVSWLEPYSPCHICLEATGSYSLPLALFLCDQNIDVSIENPARIHAFGQSELLRNKTDAGDAKMIARYCSMHMPRLWSPPPLSERELTALVRHLNKLLEMRVMENNRLLVAEVVVQGSLAEIIRVLEEQIKETRKKIAEHIDRHPDLRKNKELLESIPGVGPGLSASLMAFLGNMSRFKNSKAVVAYAGLNPRKTESGLFRGQSRISKQGNRELRQALYMPALSALRLNPIVNALWLRMKKEGKGGKVGVCAAMRKLLQLAYGVVKSGKPFDAKIMVVA